MGIHSRAPPTIASLLVFNLYFCKFFLLYKKKLNNLQKKKNIKNIFNYFFRFIVLLWKHRMCTELKYFNFELV